jgi:TonB family protein
VLLLRVLVTLVVPALSLPALAAEHPLTVGSVARGILKPQEPGVVEMWRAALRDLRPEVRAAAGRAVTIGVSRELGPLVLEALASETDVGVLDELTRAAVVLHPESHDATLVSRVRSVEEAQALARALLRVRAAGARVHLPALLKAGFKPEASYVDALLGEPGVQEWLVRQALDQGDPELWRAVLQAGGLERAGLPPEALVQGLSSSNGDIRVHTLSYLVERSVKSEAITPAVRSAFEGTTPVGEVALPEAIRRELLSRALGSVARVLPEWNAQLSLEAARAYRELLWPPTLSLFTRAERDTLSRMLTGEKDDLEKRLQGRARSSGARPQDQEFVLWTLSGLPPGYFRGVLEATGCSPAENMLGGVDVSFHPDGRPRRLVRHESRLLKDCREAVTILGASVIAPAGLVPKGNATILVLLDPEVVACSDERPPSSGLRPPSRAYGQIREPKRVRNASPNYPENAAKAGREGAVVLEATVSPSGCISGLRLVSSPDHSLTWAAIQAVSKWRYTPTLLDGQAVPVIMTVTVNFRLS